MVFVASPRIQIKRDARGAHIFPRVRRAPMESSTSSREPQRQQSRVSEISKGLMVYCIPYNTIFNTIYEFSIQDNNMQYSEL